jgi:hypothetical protein
MRRYRFFAAQIAAIGLAACATPYQPPTSGDAASLTIVNQAAVPVGVNFHLSASECTGLQSLPQVAANSESTVRIPAGKEWALTLGSVVNTKRCSFTSSFLPEKDRSYRLTYRYLGDGSVCQVMLSRLDGGPVALEKRKPRVPFDVSGSWCEPK